MLYWMSVGVGEHTFYTLVERAVVEDILINGKRRVTADRPTLVEAYVLTKPTTLDREMMQNDFKQHLARRTQTAALGNLLEFIAASTSAPSDAAANVSAKK